jgi:hypothetical protein
LGSTIARTINVCNGLHFSSPLKQQPPVIESTKEKSLEYVLFGGCQCFELKVSFDYLIAYGSGAEDRSSNNPVYSSLLSSSALSIIA